MSQDAQAWRFDICGRCEYYVRAPGMLADDVKRYECWRFPPTGHFTPDRPHIRNDHPACGAWKARSVWLEDPTTTIEQQRERERKEQGEK